MAVGKFYKKVWEDEELRKNQITQKQVKLIVDAVARTIIKSIKEEREVNWQNLFTLKSVRVKGWKNKSLHDGKEEMIKDFNRVYIRPSKRMREEINPKEPKEL